MVECLRELQPMLKRKKENNMAVQISPTWAYTQKGAWDGRENQMPVSYKGGWGLHPRYPLPNSPMCRHLAALTVVVLWPTWPHSQTNHFIWSWRWDRPFHHWTPEGTAMKKFLNDSTAIPTWYLLNGFQRWLLLWLQKRTVTTYCFCIVCCFRS